MSEIFRKGQMVPKRLSMVLTHRRAQHLLTFGCDVVVDGREVRTVMQGDGPMIVLPRRVCRTRTNGTKQQYNVLFLSFIVTGAEIDECGEKDRND